MAIKRSLGRLANRLGNGFAPIERELRREFPLSKLYPDHLERTMLIVPQDVSARMVADEGRYIRLDSSRERPTSLIIECAIIATDDGMVHMMGTTSIGITWALNKSDELWSPRFEPMPVESLQAEEAVDHAVTEVAHGLPQWLEAFTRRIERDGPN
jgi:hypothetical protein